MKNPFRDPFSALAHDGDPVPIVVWLVSIGGVLGFVAGYVLRVV